jgi:hypothetical protein
MTMTTAPAVLDGQDGVVVDHDPAARPRRRTFTAAFKAEILDRYDAEQCLKHVDDVGGVVPSV